ncbi:hypothetical protein NEUTE2DRAFT_124134 [Neurospora tetrasperma FGSC 2509]|nr:hypothetical protein NEUTE2DRAFT_124134 [Neurospora tetrasperma FGSC 2509]
MAYSKYSSDRAPGREHIPLYPKGFIAIRIIQLIIAILIAGLSAFGVHIFAFDGDVLILAVAVMTLISSTYHLITRFSTPKAYNYWAVLAVDILVLVLWLASFALLASEIIWFFTLWTSSSESIPTVDPYYDDFIPDEDSYDPYTYGILAALKGAVGNKARSSGGDDGRYGDSGLNDIYDDGGYDKSAVVATLIAPICVIAAAALGGIEFILHLISLIIHSVFLHRHRAAGLHSKPAQSSPSSNSSSGSDNSNTILFSPNAVLAPAAIVTTPNEKLPYHHQEIDSTPISVPSTHDHRQNHNQQPSAPAPAYTPVSSQQQQHQQQPYLQQQNHQQQQQQPHHQRQYQAYQQPQGQGQGQPSVYYSPVSPQTTRGTMNYTQFQQPWAVSPVPTTPPVPTHYGPTGVRAGIYQLP